MVANQVTFGIVGLVDSELMARCPVDDFLTLEGALNVAVALMGFPGCFDKVLCDVGVDFEMDIFGDGDGFTDFEAVRVL